MGVVRVGGQRCAFAAQAVRAAPSLGPRHCRYQTRSFKLGRRAGSQLFRRPASAPGRTAASRTLRGALARAAAGIGGPTGTGGPAGGRFWLVRVVVRVTSLSHHRLGSLGIGSVDAVGDAAASRDKETREK